MSTIVHAGHLRFEIACRGWSWPGEGSEIESGHDQCRALRSAGGSFLRRSDCQGLCEVAA